MLNVISAVVFALLATVPQAQAPNATGRWSVVVNAPDGPHTTVLTIKKEGETLSGTITEEGAADALKVTGTQKGADVVISFSYPSGDGPIPITLTGVQSGDGVEGTATFGSDTGTWSGKRTRAAADRQA